MTKDAVLKKIVQLYIEMIDGRDSHNTSLKVALWAAVEEAYSAGHVAGLHEALEHMNRSLHHGKGPKSL